MTKATLSFHHRDDVQASQVDLQPFVNVFRNLLGRTPGSIADFQANSSHTRKHIHVALKATQTRLYHSDVTDVTVLRLLA